MSSPTLRTLHAHDGVAVGEVGNVCIVLWRGPVTRPRFEKQREGLRDVVQRHPAGAGFVCVIEPTAKPPDDELRRSAAAMVRAHEPVLRGVACVVEGTGFVNALARSALSGMALLIGPRRVPLSVVGSVGDASTWLAPRIGLKDPAALARAVEGMRGALDPWPAGAP